MNKTVNLSFPFDAFNLIEIKSIGKRLEMFSLLVIYYIVLQMNATKINANVFIIL